MPGSGQSGHGHFGQNRFSGNEHRVTACLAPCDAGYPVIATINNNNGLHEILIIGYKNGDRYVIVDPSSGRIKVIDGDKLSNLIKIEGYSVYNK